MYMNLSRLLAVLFAYSDPVHVLFWLISNQLLASDLEARLIKQPSLTRFLTCLDSDDQHVGSTVMQISYTNIGTAVTLDDFTMKMQLPGSFIFL